MTTCTSAFEDLLSTNADLGEKCGNLEQILSPYHRIGIAFSGGVDSTFLAWFAKEKAGKPVSLFFANSDFITARERENAFQTSAWLMLDLQVIELNPLDTASVRSNPVDRCYFCKKEVFSRILARAEEFGYRMIADGSHAGDLGYRPGKKALAELGILSPLAIAGLVKDEIRQLGRASEIPNWGKPSQSCLATRVPYGTPLTRELLSKIEKAEDLLHSLGCAQVRVRFHGDLARIEVGQDNLTALVSPDNREEIVKQFGALGFSHITLDLACFRSGSWDKDLQ